MDQHTSWIRRHAFSLFLSVVCAFLAVQVVLLARQNRSLKAALAAEPPAAPRIGPGDLLHPFTVQAADGTATRFEFEPGDPRTLLMVYADACAACPQVFPYWEEIAPRFAATSARTVALQLDASHPGVERSGLAGLPTYSLADASEVPLEKLTTVPLTMLVDGTGVVEWVHHGTFAPAVFEELEALLP